MSGQRILAGVVAAALSAAALVLGGCSYDYVQHTDRVSFSAGDSVKANLERETDDPSHRSMYDTSGLGKNGSVQPKPDSQGNQTKPTTGP